MRRTFSALTLATVITASLSATPLSADTEFEDSIPIDLARSLLSGTGGTMDVKIYSDIPETFPDFKLPDGVTLVGSVHQTHNKQVVLRSDGDGTEQQAALIESLQDSDWLLIQQMSAGARQTGFVYANPQPRSIPVQLCHDSLGLIFIRLHPESDHTFINITATPGMNLGGYNCADRASQASRAQGFSPFAGGSPNPRSLQTSMPRLVLPEEAATQSPRVPMFLSGSSDQMESKTEFTIDWSLAEVREFFSEQIVEQDWALDSETAGDRVALGAWTKEEDDRVLLGTLQLVSKGEDSYQAIFSVSLLD
jgi:hypothetical protein